MTTLNCTVTLIITIFNITFYIFTLSNASSFIFYSKNFMFRLDMSVRVSLLISFVRAIQEWTPKHRFLATFIGNMSSVSAFMPILSLAFFTFKSGVTVGPVVFSLHWHDGQHIVHHCFKEVQFT